MITGPPRFPDKPTGRPPPWPDPDPSFHSSGRPAVTDPGLPRPSFTPLGQDHLPPRSVITGPSRFPNQPTGRIIPGLSEFATGYSVEEWQLEILSASGENSKHRGVAVGPQYVKNVAMLSSPPSHLFPNRSLVHSSDDPRSLNQGQYKSSSLQGKLNPPLSLVAVTTKVAVGYVPDDSSDDDCCRPPTPSSHQLPPHGHQPPPKLVLHHYPNLELTIEGPISDQDAAILQDVDTSWAGRTKEEQAATSQLHAIEEDMLHLHQTWAQTREDVAQLAAKHSSLEQADEKLVQQVLDKLEDEEEPDDEEEDQEDRSEGDDSNDDDDSDPSHGSGGAAGGASSGYDYDDGPEYDGSYDYGGGGDDGYEDDSQSYVDYDNDWAAEYATMSLPDSLAKGFVPAPTRQPMMFVLRCSGFTPWIISQFSSFEEGASPLFSLLVYPNQPPPFSNLGGGDISHQGANRFKQGLF